jgi:MFS family permease
MRGGEMRVRAALVAAIIALPLVMAVAQLALRHQATLLDLSPAPYPNGNISDSLYYWHQAESFAAYGLGSGYYTVDEQPASASISPFYTWGMFVPAFYRSIGAMFGWYPASIPIINLALLTLALAAFILLLRPNTAQLLLVAAFVITSNAFHIQYASSMTTVLHLAAGVALSIFVIIILSPHRSGTHGRALIAFVVLLTIALLLLPTWGTLFVFVGAYIGRKSWRRLVLGAVIGGLLFVLLTFMVQTTGAPFPNTLSSIMETLPRSLSDAWALLLANIERNLRDTLRGTIVEVVTRLQVLLLALAALGAWAWSGRQRTSTDLDATPMTLWELAFHAINLGSIYLLMFTLYEQSAGRDYRLFAPRLLLSALVLVGMKRYRTASVLLLTMAAALPFALYDAGAWAEAHISRDANAYYHDQQAQFATVLPYDTDAVSRWCNTVLMSFDYVATRPAVPMAITAGVGLSWMTSPKFEAPARSRYLLLTDDDYQAYADRANLTPLLSVPDGALYLNTAAAC